MTTPVSSLTAAGRPTERSSPLRLVRGLIVTALCALLACALQGALSAGVARAAAPGLVSSGEFASLGGLGVAVDNSCSLHVPPLTGSACTEFDPSANDVFVTPFLSINSTTNEFALGQSGKFNSSDELLSLLPSFPAGLYYGAAVNPTDGDLYVAGVFSEAIGTYDPNTGAPISSFPVPPFFTESESTGSAENLAQIATDSAGNVYVPNVPGNEVLEYSPAPTVVGGVAVPLATFTGTCEKAGESPPACAGFTPFAGPTGVAVDSSGDVWVADDGANRIEEFGPAGEFKSEFKSEGVRSIALDAHGDVFAIVHNGADYCGGLPSPCAHLVEYSTGGARLADVGAGSFGLAGGLAGEVGPPFIMVAVNQASGRVYVTDGLKEVVHVYQPPELPTVGRESAAEVGVFEAKLGAVATAGGGEATYRFEYLSEAAFQANKESFSGPEQPVSVPFPEGSVSQGFSPRTVWASAKGLTPGTTYHYRAVVTNGLGSVVGPDQTFTTETLAQTACPNENSRGGFSGALPDCRAYEAVVPPNKASAQPFSSGDIGGSQPANDGNRFYWTSAEVLPGSKSAGLQDLATRGASGWSSEDLLPLQYYGDRCVWYAAGVAAFSPDLSKAVERDNWPAFGAGNPCWVGESFEVVPGETPNVINLLLRDNTTGAYRLIDVPPPGVKATAAGLVAASADLKLVIFNNGAALTPDAPNGGNFEWSEGVVRLLKFGAPVADSLASIVHISDDGSELFFTAEGDLYVRVNRERTVQLDKKALGVPGPGGGGSFAAVTADGSRVFFTDDASAGLTKDTVPGSGTNLYRYDVGTGRLSDLTPVSDAKAGFVGVGEDGSRVYFTAESVMSGSQTNQFGETAESGKSNLYVDHGGTIVFVMHGGGVGMSANGAFLAFQAHGKAVVYSAAANRFACASCTNPGAEAPSAGDEGGDGVSNNGQGFFQTAEALLPRDTNGGADVYEYSYATGLHLITTGTSSSGARLLGSSASGNDVFFLGRQALLPGEPNGEFQGIYDARVDGGFPVTAVPPACTTADACRAAPAPQPSIFGEPASQTFSGAGNLAPPPPVLKTAVKSKKCKKGFVKKKGRCVKSKGKKKKAKAKKSAHANRRASR
jgi:hypothetical protein